MSKKHKSCPFNETIETQYIFKDKDFTAKSCSPNSDDCKKCGWNPAIAELRYLAANDASNWKQMYIFNSKGIIVKEYKSLKIGGIKIE